MACNLHSLCGPPTMDMGEGRSLPPTSLPPVYGGWWITDVNPADCTSVQERYNPLVSVFPFPVGTGHHGSRPSRYTVPRTPPDLLERPRLLEFLQRHLNRKLILVCASPGYGKTALAVNFAHQADFPLAWLSLDETDRDIVTIVGDLFQALHRALLDWLPPPPETLGLPSAASQPVSLGLALTQALDQAATDFTVLVIDDFHLVDDSPAVIEFFDSFIESLPPQLHVILLSRRIPPLKIASLAARQEIAGISEEHLRFTAAEVQALLQKRNNLTLPTNDAETLVSHTEGWITGILLSSQLIWRGLLSNVGMGRDQYGMVYDYLAEEVLEQQPQDLRLFLMEAAVLPEMDPPSCDAILERSDSAKMLDQVEARRLFVTAVGEPQPSYRFHHLFREFLSARLRQRNPLRMQSLQRRAAEWYAQNGLPEAAFNLFIAAGDQTKAGALADAQATPLFEAGRREILLEWARQLKDIALDVPRLQLVVTDTLIDRGEIDKAEEAAAIAQAGFERRLDREGLVRVEVRNAWLCVQRRDFAEGLRGAIAVLERGEDEVQLADRALAARYAGRCELELNRPRESLEHLRQSSNWFASINHEFNHALALTDLALVLRVLGQTAEVAQVQQKSLNIWRKMGVPGPIARVLNNIGYDLHMLGQYQSARATYQEAIDWARKAGERQTQANILVSQADLLRDLGEGQWAADLYSNALKIAQESGDNSLQGYVFWEMADLNRSARNFPAALEWLRRADLAVGQPSLTPPARHAGLHGAILTEMGDIQAGRLKLEEAQGRLEASEGSYSDVAWVLLLLARCQFRLGWLEKSEASLNRALKLARDLGYDQMLVREAEPCRDLLEGFADSAELGPQVRALLARARAMVAQKDELVGPAHPEAPSPIQIHALGPARVVVKGREVQRSEWVSQRARELFFFLVDRAPVNRDELLATFWPDIPQGRALTNLYQTLYRLRRALGEEVVVLREQTCHFSEALEMRYDVATFEGLARGAIAMPFQDLRRVGALEAAIQAYSGEYLAYLPVDWARQRREELSEEFVRVLREYADELISVTRYAEARAALTRALAAEPLRDDLHQRMLKVLAAQGRVHEVVDHYQHYCEALRREMGLDPPSETRSLYGSLIS